MIKKWDFKCALFIFSPKNIGNQWVIPAKIAKTAPIDKT